MNLRFEVVTAVKISVVESWVMTSLPSSGHLNPEEEDDVSNGNVGNHLHDIPTQNLKINTIVVDFVHKN